MASPDNGSTSNERWENLRRHQQGEPDMGKTERVISGLAGVTLMALTLRTRRLRPFLVPVATGLIAKALTGQPGKQKLSDLWRRKEGRVSPGGQRRAGAGNQGRGERHHQPSGGGGVSLLAQLRESSPFHGPSRSGHRDRRHPLALGGQGSGRHPGGMGCRHPQRDRRRADRLAFTPRFGSQATPARCTSPPPPTARAPTCGWC